VIDAFNCSSIQLKGHENMTNIHFLTLLMVNSFLSQLQVSLLIYAALLLSMP